jgi:hypothetical protein
MKAYVLTAVFLAALCATLGCAPAVRWREPLTLADGSTNSYVDSNMLTFAQRRMALPEGWSFQGRKPSDAKPIMFWIRDTGGQDVSGVYSFESIGVPLYGATAVERFAQFRFKDFSDVVAQKTEIDHTEAYVVQGSLASRRWRKIHALMFDHPPVGTAVSEIDFLGDEAYVDQNRRVLYAILNTFKIVPRGLSERKIKGAFSFKCDDDTFSWLSDSPGRWQKNGFSVAGRVEDNGLLMLSVRQVMTTRFADFIKMEIFDPHEFQTVLHLAGGSFPARAIHRNNPDQKVASTVLLFQREGKDYMVEVIRAFKTHPDTVDPAMQDAPSTRAALDSKFYFYD